MEFLYVTITALILITPLILIWIIIRSNRPNTKCPHCRQPIYKGGTICPFCRRDL